MKALTVIPQKPRSLAVVDMPDPEVGAGHLQIKAIAVGVCGTDREIAAGDYGWAPSGAERLIIGHESLGQVVHAPDGTGFTPGDLVVGVVRRPDPEPCGACAHGQFDMCRNGRYAERGIKQLHGYASEQWTVEPDYAVKLDPALGEIGVLLEPTTVVAKAWDQVEKVGSRAWFEPRTVLITGAGPIGLLAALLGVQRGLEVHVLDQVTDGPKLRAPISIATGPGSPTLRQCVAKQGRPPASHSGGAEDGCTCGCSPRSPQTRGSATAHRPRGGLDKPSQRLGGWADGRWAHLV